MQSLSAILNVTPLVKLLFQAFISGAGSAEKLEVWDLKWILIIPSVISFFPLFHILAHLTCAMSLVDHRFLFYICLSVPLDALWYVYTHKLNLPSFVLVISSDIISTIIFATYKWRHLDRARRTLPNDTRAKNTRSPNTDGWADENGDDQIRPPSARGFMRRRNIQPQNGALDDNSYQYSQPRPIESVRVRHPSETADGRHTRQVYGSGAIQEDGTDFGESTAEVMDDAAAFQAALAATRDLARSIYPSDSPRADQEPSQPQPQFPKPIRIIMPQRSPGDIHPALRPQPGEQGEVGQATATLSPVSAEGEEQRSGDQPAEAPKTEGQ